MKNEKKKGVTAAKPGRDSNEKMFLLLVSIAAALLLGAVITVACITAAKAPRPEESSSQTQESGENAAKFDGTENNFQYKILPNGTVSIYHYLGQESALVIPATLAGRAVTELSSESFLQYDLSNLPLTSLYLPRSIAVIGDHVFGDKTGFSVTYEGSLTEWDHIEIETELNPWAAGGATCENK